uniref:Si:ch211-199b20.3 n=1 Tax=Neogobius melanostomus TaxID=47308 RepID=A0A8C6UN99_9GOBI
MSLHFKQDHKDRRDCPDLCNTATLKSIKPFEATQEKSCQGKATGSLEESPLTHCSQADNFHLEHQISHVTFTQDTDELSTIPSPACASGKALSLISKELRSFSPSLPIGTSTVQPPLSASRNSSPVHPSTFLCEAVNSLPQTVPKCESLKVTELPETQCGERTFDKASKSCSQTPESSPSVCKMINLDKEPFSCEDDFGVDSLLSFSWEESGEEEIEGLKCTVHHPHKMINIMYVDEEDCIIKPQILCRQSLSMVYSTIEESYQDGTLELLSDLMLPGYYPPKDITSHLLWGILLNPQSPHHNCVQAFDLLMRTQRYHIADKWSAPWDWEMLSNVIEKQEHRPETVRMFLEYVVQTLEDDFRIKQTTSALYQSLAKAVLSFDHQFSHIRDVCKWLFSAIVKSTDCNEMVEEHTRIVAIFQRMLSLALEVDCSPAIGSNKLSQELFHMLISSVPPRRQRMLLLESLQSKLLMCKLLEHLLDYSCPVKTSVPMSLSLLLHFLKNCTLSPDPKDGTEKWRRWEELVCLLWMLLLSYNNAMKGITAHLQQHTLHVTCL